MRPLLLALLALGGTAFGAAGPSMVIYEGSLENGWQNYGWATINYTNRSPVYSGTASISVVDPGTSYEALYLGHNAFDSSPYESLSFWVYPTVAGTGELQVQATVNGNPQPAVQLSFSATQVRHWQHELIPLSRLGVAGNTGLSGFWIQNITGGPLTFYVDAISLTPIPPPNPIRLTVDAQNVIRTIDSRMYGMNITMWDNLLSGTATSNLLAAIETGALRFPGGSNSDDYDWHTGRSVSNGSFRWVNNSPTFAGIAAAQGAQAFVTVNYGSGTPEEAAAWVAYYNGDPSSTAVIGVDSRGINWNTVGYWASIRGAAPLAIDDGYNYLRASHHAPYAFRYWEIGNECYGNWENDLHGANGSGLSGAAHDPYTYAQAFKSFFNEMLAVDPTIRIGAVATPGEDSYGNGTHGVANSNEGNAVHTGWTPVMLATLESLGVTPHFLIDHVYPQNPGNEDDAVLLQDGSKIVTDAAKLRQRITDYIGAAQGASIELDMTELNSVSSSPGKQTTSLVNGLFLADALGNLANTEFNACTWWALRCGAVTAANNSASLYGWRPFGDYGVVASGGVSRTPANTPFPAYCAASLLTHWGRGGDSVVSAASNYGLLSIYAARLANGSLALLVINKDPNAELTAQITLANFTPGSTSAAVYFYGKPNDLANKGVTTSTASIPSASFTHTFPSYSMTVLVVKGKL